MPIQQRIDFNSPEDNELKLNYNQILIKYEDNEYLGDYPPNVPLIYLYLKNEIEREQEQNDFKENMNSLPRSDMLVSNTFMGQQYLTNQMPRLNNENKSMPSFPQPQLIDSNVNPYELNSNLLPNHIPMPSLNSYQNNINNDTLNQDLNNLSMPTLNKSDNTLNQGLNKLPMPSLNPYQNDNSFNQELNNLSMPMPWESDNHGPYQDTQPVPMQPTNFMPQPQHHDYPQFSAPPQPQPIDPEKFDLPPTQYTAPEQQPLPQGANNVVQVSNFTGRKKALLIGINYFNTKFALKGCINDVKNIQQFIHQSYQFPLEGMVVLTDDQVNNPIRMPTKHNIVLAMQWLVEGARPNDSLFFHFSGHGSQTPDLDGDEEDGFDETICPLDFQHQGQIVDDDMNLILVQPLPSGCRLTAIFDCCHSGTALDLPYVYSSQGKLKSFNPAKSALSALVDLGTKSQLGDLVGALKTLKVGYDNAMKAKRIEKSNQKTKGGLADVIMFSGCKDSQTSADALDSDLGNTGAMSMALIVALHQKPYNLTYLDLLLKVRDILAEKKFTQVPQLSTARPMDMHSIFRM